MLHVAREACGLLQHCVLPNILQMPCLPLLTISWWGSLVQVALLEGVLRELREAGAPPFNTDV